MSAPATAPVKPKTAIATLDVLKDKLTRARDKLAEVAPKYMSIDRLTRLMLLACGKSPKILACTPESILQFSMKCAETGLEPIGAGGCWPIPYGTTLTFIPDYRGLVHCAVRAGVIKEGAKAEIVRAADLFDYELGLTPYLKHKPARGDRGELDAAYCIYELPNGDKQFVVMDRADILAIKSRSKSANSGPWVTDEAEMWKKTVVRRAMKPFAGISSALDAAIDADDKAGGVVDVDREPVPMPKAIGETPAPEADAAPSEPENPEVPEKNMPLEVAPCTAEQRDDLEEYRRNLGLNEADIKHLLSEAKAKAWAKLNHEQADIILKEMGRMAQQQSGE